MKLNTLFKTTFCLFLLSLLFVGFTTQFEPTHPFITKLQQQLSQYGGQLSDEKVYVQLDRNFYQPGDIVWYSIWVRNANSLLVDDISETVYVELIDPKGTTIKKQVLDAKKGSASGSVQLKTSVGGLFKIKAYTNWQKNTKAFFEREIQVQKAVLPNLKMKLDFDRKAYGSGDQVVAHLEAIDLEDQPLRLLDVGFIVSLDGKSGARQKLRLDFDGKADVKFTLPEKLTSSDGLLQVIIPHKGQNESISRSIPIVFDKIDLQFFPEGGDLVAGLPTNIAFKALNEYGKPADVEGAILNDKGEQVATFSSFHNGMGATKLWPEKGNRYTARITKPEGIDTLYQLPAILPKGMNLTVTEQQPNVVKTTVQTTRTQPVHLVVQSNDKLVFSKSFMVDKKEEIAFSTKSFPMGISRITLFDEFGQAKCERLIFVQSDNKLNIDISTNKKQYQPREKVVLNIKVTDENDDPVAGQFALSVADDKLLTFADDKQGHILAKLFLESELKGDIEEPDFYFDDSEATATRAMDHLMMTHGWRRFDWEKVRQPEPLAFKFAKERSWVAGRVVDKANAPVVGALVSVMDKNITTSTDENGFFTLKNLKIGATGPVMKIEKEGLPAVRKSIVEYKQDYYIVMAEGYGNLAGMLLDPYDRPARRGTVTLYNDNGSQWKGLLNIKGEYSFQQLPAGLYTLDFRYGAYPAYRVEKIRIWPGEDLRISRQLYISTETKNKEKDVALGQVQESELDQLLLLKKDARQEADQKVEQLVFSGKSDRSNGINLDEIVVTHYKVPLIEQDNTSSGATITSEDITRFATKNIVSIAASTAGLSQIDEGDGVTVRGSRANATNVYVDGIRVNASQVQEADIEQLRVITGGIPAMFGGGEAPPLPENQRGNNKYGVPDADMFFAQTNADNTGFDWTSAGGTTASAWGNAPAKNQKQRASRKVRVPSVLHRVVDEQPRLRNRKCELLDSEKDCYACANEVLMDRLLDAIARTEIAKYYGGDILLEFFVDQSGVVGGLKVNGSNYQTHLTKTIRRAIYTLPKWKPARINAKAVAAEVSIPIAYGDLVGRRATKYKQTRQFYTPRYSKKQQKTTQRADYRSTIFWKPDIVTDKAGKATVEFWNSDDITTFKATVEGISSQSVGPAGTGLAGRGTHTYSTQLPFSMQVKLPVVAISGDHLKIPITLNNNTTHPMKGKLTAQLPPCIEALSNSQTQYSLPPGQSKTIYPEYRYQFDCEQKRYRGKFIRFSFETSTYSDQVQKPLQLQSAGFPVEELLTGTEMKNDFELVLNDPRKGSLQASLVAHPNVVSEAMATADRMLRQPGGCFEQTSSSNYPNLLVMTYMKRNRGVFNAATYNKAEKYLKVGYKRLIGFEVEGGGFHWFGKPPAHESLTAYGIMQFVDMKAVFPVEKAMLDRTVKWMLDRRDGKGGWKVSTKGAHRWKGNSAIRNAYINWAMAEAGYGSEIEKEIDHSFEKAVYSKDPYLLALVANTLLGAGDIRGHELTGSLLQLQDTDGSFMGKTTSITMSQGKNLQVETTALAALAMMEMESVPMEELERAIRFLALSKTAKGYCSTQSTVLSLKAILGYAGMEKSVANSGKMLLYVNDQLVRQQQFSTRSPRTITFDNFSHLLQNGKNRISVQFADCKKTIPFELLVTYTSSQPQHPADDCKLAFQTHLSNQQVQQGHTVRLTTQLQNKTDGLVTSPIAIVGIPSGLSPQPWQLKELQEKEVFDYYEVKDNKVVFYLLEMTAGAEKTIHLDLKADIPGTYESPASNAYLYYENDAVAWAPPVRIAIE